MTQAPEGVQSYFSSVEDWTSLCSVPSHRDKVWKDECLYCHCTPLCDGGLYINMKSHQAFCKDHLRLDAANSEGLYLIETSTKIPKSETTQPSEAVKKLGIGVEGGFQSGTEADRVEKSYKVFVRSADEVIDIQNETLPEAIRACAESIKGHNSASCQIALESWEEEPKISKYAMDLEQLAPKRNIPMDPTEWKCEETGATENLWLNLSTGHIGSGRPQWDGTGGNGAALRHYESTGKKYPLVVKLGTITPGGADVYSYASDEDDMVIDPNLGKHLAHWGINMMQMEKSEKTMAELQIERNISYEFDAITEAGAKLVPISGPGYVGLKNLGNSCYINSVLQLIWSMPELYTAYIEGAEDIFRQSPRSVDDFILQFTKVGMALSSNTQGCSRENHSEQRSISPWMFKRICGQRHHEFSTSNQQDAQEFLSFLLEQISRAERQNNERVPGFDTISNFQFTLETRVECNESKYVSYKTDKATLVSLQIPLDCLADSPNREMKRQKLPTESQDFPHVPLSACFDQFCGQEKIEDYFSASLRRHTNATKTTKFASFPRYLVAHVRRYYIDETWTPRKLEVKIDVPEYLSLAQFRAAGPQEGEKIQPEIEEEANDALVQELSGMGFPIENCRKAVLATGNKDLEPAMEYLLANNICDSADEKINESSIQSLCDMGFSAEQAKHGLEQCDGSIERAIDWLFNHADDIQQQQVAKTETISSSSEYELVGFVSHVGKNTSSGHYVCHVKKNNMWVIYNDEKVAKSGNPPFELGYMYFYRQKI
eukprot:jgi/Picsp_1/4286/NSC_01795-R1_ubiquitin carboxyl-terminal hydrolase 5 isoform 2